MIVTGALIADKAAVYDQKLAVLGGVYDWFVTGSQGEVSFDYVVLLQSAPEDNDTGLIHLEITNESGATIAGPLPIPVYLPAGSVNGFVVRSFKGQISPGRINFIFTTSTVGGGYTLPLEIRAPA